jgi:hypothetical protein
LSLQVVPFALLGAVPHPVEGEQVGALWHWSGGSHVTVAPVQFPLWQLSGPVQALLSLQVVPFALGGAVEAAGHPVAATQVGALWHWSAPLHVTAMPPPQVPLDWQVVWDVHMFPSSHGVPAATAHTPVVVEQGLQTPHAVPEFIQVPVASQT